MVRMERLVRLAPEVQEVFLAWKDPRVEMGKMARLAEMVFLGQKDCRVIRVLWVLRVKMVKTVKMVLLDARDLLEYREEMVSMVSMDHKEKSVW